MRCIVLSLFTTVIVALNSTTSAVAWQATLSIEGVPTVLAESVSVVDASQPPSDQPTPAVTMRKVIGPDGKETEIPVPEGTPLPPGFKPVDGNAKPDASGKPAAGAAPAGPPAAVQRPSAPSAPPDRKELQIKPDEEGMVQFSFRNQSWPDLLKWLAEVSGMSLDWQELPGDFVNITTQRKYSLEETRSL